MKLNFADFSGPSDSASPGIAQTQPSPKPAAAANSDPNYTEASSTVSDAQFRRVNRTPSQFYIPGKTPGQPHKESVYRYCYNITKKAGKQAN